MVAQVAEIDSILTLYPNQSGLDRVTSLTELAWYYKNIDLDSAMMFARLGQKEAQKTNDHFAITSSLNSLANVFEAKSQMDSALDYHGKSLEIEIEYADSLGIASTYNNLGIIYDLQGQYEKSLSYYYQSLEIYETLNLDPYQEAMVLGNIGIVLKKQKQYGKTLEYYKRALAIYEEEQSDFGIAVTTGNIGSLLIRLKQFDEAIAYSEKAVKGYEVLGHRRYVPYPMHNMAIAYDSLNQYDKAEKLYRQCVKLYYEGENWYELASTFTNLAHNQHQQGQYLSGVALADSAITYADRSSSPEFLVRAMKIQAESYAALGQYDQAYRQLLISTTGQDSLFEKDKTRAIVELETKYETAQKEQKIKLQQATIREKDLEIERDRILLSGSGIVILLMIFLAVLIQKKEKWKREKMEEEARAQRERDQMTAVISSQENERKRFAADIHDGFGQLISVLKINLSSLDKVRNSNNAAKTRQELYEGSVKIIDEMYAELRNVCFNIMPQTLVKHGLPAAFKEFADRLNATGSIRTEVLVYDIDDRLEDIQEISLYRITQEVVNNILKYADASNITIQLTQDESEITLMIEDDGKGFDPMVMQSSKGNGWKNLNTRSNFINGRYEYDSTPGIQGTTFFLNLPVGSITYEADTVLHG